MHLILILVVTAIFLIANGVLWYARPSGGLWLIASLLLGVAWGAAFLRLVTRS